MKLLVFEPFSGASGDMIIGSLLDLGIEESKIEEAISVFDLEMEVKEVEKRGITAKKVRFVSKSNKHSERGPSVKSYEEIVKTIANSGLNKEIIVNSLRIFELIADAESKVHGEPKQRLRFHELGAMDTIGDLVGSSTAFLGLPVDCAISMPISVGEGFVETEHGFLPVPAPATVEILKKTALLYQSGPFAAVSELLTPTGAAILAHFVQRSVPFLPPLQVEETGYGAGSRDLPMPNVLRTSICETDTYLLRDEVEVLETNVDNVTGEVLGNLIEVLMADGAKDVAIVPALMKKGRSGHIIRVITAPQDISRLAHRIMVETGSLGVRVMQVRHRFIANREQKKVKVRIKGIEREVGVKIGRTESGDLLNVTAEFEDAKRVARELRVPLKDVITIVEEEARKNLLE